MASSSTGGVGGISGLRGPPAIDDSRRQRQEPEPEEESDLGDDDAEGRAEAVTEDSQNSDSKEPPGQSDGPRKGQFIDERC